MVFRKWTEEQLNDQISQKGYMPQDPVAMFEKYGQNSYKSRIAFPAVTYAYGEGPNEKLDIFGCQDAKELPVMVFIHGGGWALGSKDHFSTAAPTFINANAMYIALGFDNTPPKSISVMIDQCRNAISWIWKNAKKLGIDPSKIYVSGHSSGGHLANMMLATEWKKLGLPEDVIKGGLIMSGWTDLYPISLSNRQSYLKLTEEDIQKFSPIRHLKNINCQTIISWGSGESPYMQMQSVEWAKMLKSNAHLAGAYRLAGCNHYEIPDELNRSDSQLTQATLALMNLV